MSLTIIAIFRLLQILVFQFLATPSISKVSYKQALARNKDWVMENPEIMKQFKEPRGLLHYVLGVVLILTLAYAYMFDDRVTMEWVKLASIFGMLIQNLGIDMYQYFKMKKIIPKRKVRKANLIPRKVSDYVPTWAITFVIVGYLGIGLLAVTQFFQGQLDQKQLIHISKPLIIFCIIFVPLFIYVIKRKPIEAMEKVALLYRNSEVTVIKICILGGLVVLFFRWATESYSFEILSNFKDVVGILYSSIPMFFFIWFCTNKNFKALMNEDFNNTNKV